MNELQEVSRDFGDVVKHEARLKLWLPPLQDLYRELQRPIKYFTLPGSKAYDVVLWEINQLVRHDGKGYPDVCFCDCEHNSFANAKRILGNTRGLLARFEDVVLGGKDKRYAAFLDLFPYDVYNLDFCGTCFERCQPPVSNTFRALSTLIEKHIARRAFTPFLLLLTVRIDRGRMNQDVVQDFKDNIETNLNTQTVSESLTQLIEGNLDSFVSNRFENFIMLSIPKLLGFRLVSSYSKARISQVRRCLYARSGFHIGKFVFRIEKEKPGLSISPPWYRDFVQQSADMGDILRIEALQISPDTAEDLKRLRATVAKRELSR